MRIVIIVTAALLSAPGFARPSQPSADATVACTAATPLPPALIGWTRTPMRVMADPARPQVLAPGRRVDAVLLPTARLQLPAPLGKRAAAASNGGVFALQVPRTGRYRVALGAAAWLDVVGGGRTLPSVAHAHGPACSGVRKTVDFDLAAGRYLLQIADSATATMSLMVVRMR